MSFLSHGYTMQIGLTGSFYIQARLLCRFLSDEIRVDKFE